VDKFGRITVEIKLREAPEIPLNRARILERIEETCEREFEPPEINRSGRVYYITATEKAVFSVDCYCTQFNQGENKLCGDTCRYFFDGRGRMITILSDGMGSGGRAAVDSGLTAGLAERLLKAGFGYDCTLKLVNSAMLFKSSDESLATLDISCVDLFSGRTELLKAGAAPTLVRRNGRCGRAECKTLPAGILNEVGFDKATVTLKEDDILVMVSDGVTTDGTDWICAELEAWRGGGAKQLSERIASAARRRRRDGHDDDITVFVAILEKAM
jgi:stage II sporulation protein E